MLRGSAGTSYFGDAFAMTTLSREVPLREEGTENIDIVYIHIHTHIHNRTHTCIYI